MTAKIIDGKAIAAQLLEEVAGQVSSLKIKPRLDVVMMGADGASKVYVRKKQEACALVGIESKVHTDIHSLEGLYVRLADLGRDPRVHGILVQLPLPFGYPSLEVFQRIHPAKDVDVFHPENVGLLIQGHPRFRPCTPHGIQVMLGRSGIRVNGKHVLVINRSNIVGKPLSNMLIQDDDEFANATVTVCHDKTPHEGLVKIARQADIVVIAVGIPGFLKATMVTKGAVVVDVGISRVGNKIMGDVDPEVRDVAGYLTPCPGGVGPVTVSMLLKNTLQAAKSSIKGDHEYASHIWP